MERELNEQEKMAKFILKMRKVKGLTQKELADQLGVTDKAVSKWERAVSSPDISLLIPLSKVLGVSTGELLSGEKMETAPDEKTVSEVLRYSHKSANQRVKMLWDILFAGIFASFLLAAIICLICNYAVSGELSWSLVVLVSLTAAWGILLPFFKAGQNRIFKSLLVLTALAFPYLAILSFLLKVPLLRTMGICIGAAALLGLWGIYGILIHASGRRKYFAISMVCFLLLAEEYGMNRIIDVFLERTAAEQSFHYLKDIIIFILAAACLGVSYFREQRKQ